MGALDRIQKIGVWPRMLNAEAAAIYLGVSENFFREGVKSGRYPPPFRISTLVQWDRYEIDDAIAETRGKAQNQNLPSHQYDEIAEELSAWTPEKLVS